MAYYKLVNFTKPYPFDIFVIGSVIIFAIYAVGYFGLKCCKSLCYVMLVDKSPTYTWISEAGFIEFICDVFVVP